MNEIVMLQRTTTRLALIAFVVAAVWALASLGSDAFIMVLITSIVCSAIPLALAAIVGFLTSKKAIFGKTFRVTALVVNVLLSLNIISTLVALNSDPDAKTYLACQIASFLALLVTWDCVIAYLRKVDPRQPVPGIAATAPQVAAVTSQAQIDQLEKLSALKASGAINDEEFARLKSQLLQQAGH